MAREDERFLFQAKESATRPRGHVTMDVKRSSRGTFPSRRVKTRAPSRASSRKWAAQPRPPRWCPTLPSEIRPLLASSSTISPTAPYAESSMSRPERCSPLLRPAHAPLLHSPPLNSRHCRPLIAGRMEGAVASLRVGRIQSGLLRGGVAILLERRRPRSLEPGHSSRRVAEAASSWRLGRVQSGNEGGGVEDAEGRGRARRMEPGDADD